MANAAATRGILDFWFLPEGGYRPEWFRKDEIFDTAIRDGFSGAVEAALGSEAPADAGDEDLLARILLLDQFTRNIFRGTPRAFAGDIQALAIATALVGSGRDKNLSPWQRWFAYLPFEHSESLIEQERAQIAEAWREGNREGWEMTSDDPLDGERYYDETFNAPERI